MPSCVKLSPRIEHSFCDEDVSHVDGVRNRPEENQGSQPEDRARSASLEREDEHDEREHVGGRDRQEGGARDAYEHHNESEHPPFSNASVKPFPELAPPIFCKRSTPSPRRQIRRRNEQSPSRDGG